MTSSEIVFYRLDLWLLEAGFGEAKELDEGEQYVQISSYKIHDHKGYNIEHDKSSHCCMAYIESC